MVDSDDILSPALYIHSMLALMLMLLRKSFALGAGKCLGQPQITNEGAQNLNSFASKQTLNLWLHQKLHPCQVSCPSLFCFLTHGRAFFLIIGTHIYGSGSASGRNQLKQSQETLI